MSDHCGSETTSMTACSRCKSKKIKCDKRPVACSSCFRSKVECTTIDAFSGRVYPRVYPQYLQDRVAYLRSYINDTQVRESGLKPPETFTVAGQTIPSLHLGFTGEQRPTPASNDDGSIPSLGQKVAAEMPEETLGLRQIDQLYKVILEEQNDAERSRVGSAPLPSFEGASLLFDAYLEGVHLMHPFLKRSDIYARLSRVYGDTNYHQVLPKSPTDIFQVNMVFAIGAVKLNRRRAHHTPALGYYLAAMEHAQTALGITEDEHIQNALLLLIFGSHHHASIGNRWDFARFAMQICIEKGYHLAVRDSSFTAPMVDQMHRRMFWCTYVSERYSSSFLGRPTLLLDLEITTELPMDLDDNSIETGMNIPVASGCKSETSILIRQVRLRQITSAACTELFCISLNSTFSEKEKIVQKLVERLDSWYTESQTFRYPTTPYELAAYHELQYHRERITLFRSLAIKSDDMSSTSTERYLRCCLEDAMKVVAAYQVLAESDSLVMHWTCVNDILLSGFMILYTSLRTTRSGSPSPQSMDRDSSDDIVPSQIQGAIDVCLSILRHISASWKIIRYHLGLFEKLSSAVTISKQGGGHLNDENQPEAEIQPLQDIPLAVMSDFVPDNATDHQPFVPHAAPELYGLSMEESADFAPGPEFGISDAELRDIFVNGFQDMQWDWYTMSSSLGSGL